MSRLGRWVALAALAGGAATAADLLRRTWPLGRLPMWDSAANGWGAVELWAALANGHLFDFLQRLNAQDSWPFGFSLWMLPFVAAGGSSFESATLLPATAFALVPALLVWTGWESERSRRGLVAGLLAGALWLASPLPRALATVAMRETAGAALGVAAVAAYLRASRLSTLSAWRWAGLSLLALLFVKANYFLLTGGGLAMHVALEGERRQTRAMARRWLRRAVGRGWRDPARWCALLLAFSALWLALGHNPGTLLYAALVAATGYVALRRRAWLRTPGRALGRLRAPARALVETLGIPLWIWCLSPAPMHVRNLVAFLRNRPATQPLLSPEALVFYPLSLFNDYFPALVVAWSTAAFALAALFFLLRRGRVRAVALCAFVGSLALCVHPYKQERFLATVAPLVLLVAAIAAVRLVARLLSPRGFAAGLGGALLTLAALAGIGLAAREGARGQRLERDHRALTSPRAFTPPLDDLAARVTRPVPSGLLGGFNALSEDLVRWRAWQRYGREAALAPALRGLDGDADRATILAALERWRGAHELHRIVALQPSPGSVWLRDADYRRFNGWQIEAIELALGELRFHRRALRTYRAAGVEIATLELPVRRSASARRAKRRAPGRGSASPDRR